MNSGAKRLNNPPPGWGSGKDYAAHRRSLGLSGGTPAAVSQAKSAGRISPPNTHGWYCFAQADAEWLANTRSQHLPDDNGRHHQGRPPANPAPSHPGPHEPPEPGYTGPAPSYTPAPATPAALPVSGLAPDRKTWDAWKTYWEAEAKRMEAQKMAGGLVEREKAELVVAALFRGIRDNLLGIPSRLRVALADIDDPAQIEHALNEELYRALENPDFSRLFTAAA